VFDLSVRNSLAICQRPLKLVIDSDSYTPQSNSSAGDGTPDRDLWGNSGESAGDVALETDQSGSYSRELCFSSKVNCSPEKQPEPKPEPEPKLVNDDWWGQLSSSKDKEEEPEPPKLQMMMTGAPGARIRRKIRRRRKSRLSKRQVVVNLMCRISKVILHTPHPTINNLTCVLTLFRSVYRELRLISKLR